MSGAGPVSSGEVAAIREVIAAVAPEELPLVDAMAQLDPDTVTRQMRELGDGGEPLGFGITEAVALATPVLWLVMQQIMERFGEAAAEEALRRSGSLWRRLLRRPRPAREVPELTREQLAEVHAQVLALSAERGLEPERAAALADALIAELALGNTAPRDGAPDPEPA
ncbi:hypothetical protein ACWEKT_28045 [Nocardia takedensis]